jgi:hypothetical protein
MLKYLFSLLLMSFISFALTAQTQFQNPSFEDWEEVGLGPELLEPVNWSSIKTGDDDNINQVGPVIWEISNDAHEGEHSIRLFNVAVFGIVATGTITNGRVHADFNPDLAYVYTDTEDEHWNTPFTGRPDSVVGWYKANMEAGDNPAIRIVLHTGYQQLPGDMENVVAEAMLNLPAESVTEWTRFSVPFVYEKDIDPEYLLAILYSGNGTSAIGGSEAWFDDLAMVYPTAITEISAKDLRVFYTHGELNINLTEKHPQNYKLQIVDLMGRIVLKQEIHSGSNNRIPVQLNKGVYVVSILDAGGLLSKKIFIQ